MLRKLVGLLAVLSAVPASGQAIATVTSVDKAQATVTLPKKISVAFDNTPIAEAIWTVARRAGTNITFDGAVLPDRKVRYKAENMGPESILAAILVGTGFKPARAVDGTFELVRIDVSKDVKAQGIITGRVTDAKTGRGLSGANVSVERDTRGVSTGGDGSYRLPGVSTGTHTVAVRLVGYVKQARSVTVGEGATVSTDFKLEPSASVLDQVIVTGTIVATELKAVPSAITVVTAKQIEERGITRIDQLFRGDIPGLFSANLGSASAIDSVLMYSRGVSGWSGATNPIKTYVDGIELANPTYLSQIDPSSIERIEILTGPQASTIYGSNAINGVMQIFTKRGLVSKPQLRLNIVSGLAQNNFNSHLAPSHNVETDMSGSEGRVVYNLGSSWNYTGAWTPGKRTGRLGGYGSGRITINKIVADASMRYSVTQNKRKGAEDQKEEYFRNSGLWGPTASMGLATPQTSTLIGRTIGLSLAFNPAQYWSNELIVGSDESHRETIETDYGYSAASDTLLGFGTAVSSRTSQRYTTTVQLPISYLAQLAVTLGGDHWRTASTSSKASGVTMTGTLTNPGVTREKPGKNSGGFLQGQLGIHDALFLTYGLRAEWNPNYGEESQPNIVPRYGVALTKELGLVTTKLRASYGRSTRPPANQLKQAAMQTSSILIAKYGPYNFRLANPELGPEFQEGGEGGVELYVGNLGSLVITRYNQTVDALIANVGGLDSVRSLELGGGIQGACTPQPDGYCYQRQSQNLNVGSIRNQGWELQGNINIGPISTRSTYSWTKSRFLRVTPKYQHLLTGPEYQPGSVFDYLPEHTWALVLSYASSSTTVGLNFNGTGFMYTPQGDFYYSLGGVNTNLYRDRTHKPRWTIPDGYDYAISSGYVMADVNATHRFSSRMEGSLQILNLTDFYRHDRTGSFATIGRQTKFGARIRW